MAEEVRRLPRGRHKLPREEVVASQRGRMLVAMAEAVAERGYVATTVADVLKRAHVSRETFYEHFADKQACFLAAHDAGVETLLATMGDGLRPPSEGQDPMAMVEDTMARYLGALAAHPAVARTFLVEVYAAGPEALAKRAAVQERFIDAVAAMVGADDERSRFLVRLWVGGVSAMVTTKVSLGRFDELEPLHGPLVEAARTLLAQRG